MQDTCQILDLQCYIQCISSSGEVGDRGIEYDRCDSPTTLRVCQYVRCHYQLSVLGLGMCIHKCVQYLICDIHVVQETLLAIPNQCRVRSFRKEFRRATTRPHVTQVAKQTLNVIPKDHIITLNAHDGETQWQSGHDDVAKMESSTHTYILYMYMHASVMYWYTVQENFIFSDIKTCTSPWPSRSTHVQCWRDRGFGHADMAFGSPGKL